MRTTALVRYALSDLRHRPGATWLNVAAVALAAAYILVLGFYGASIHRYQEELLERSLPTKIVASMPDVTDASLRLTDERMAALAELDDVALVFGRIELNVRAYVDEARAVDLPAESTTPADPSVSGDRLGLGSGVSAADAREVVLSRALFEKLGGVVAETPVPDALFVEVRRTLAGREEVHRLELRIAGLLRHEDTERIFVPIDVLTALDLWCTSKIDELSTTGGFSGGRRARFPAALAYAPESARERVATEAQALRVRTEEAGTVEIVEPPGPLWSVLERSDGAPLDEADLAAASRAGLAPREVRSATVAGARAVALGADDPRWDAIDDEHERETAYVLSADVPPAAVFDAHRSERAPAGLQVGADLLASHDELRWMLFEPHASAAASAVCLVETDDPAAARALADLGGAPAVGRELGWLFYDGSSGWGEAAELGAIVARSPGLDAGVWWQRDVPAVVEPRATARTFATRFVPAELYRRVAPPPGPLEAGLSVAEPTRRTCVLATARPFDAPAALWIGADRAQVVRTIATAGADVLWMAAPADARLGGVVVWGPWTSVAQAEPALAELGWQPERASAHRPGRVSALVTGDAASVAQKLGPHAAACRTSELAGVWARLGGAPDLGLVMVDGPQLGAAAVDGLLLRGAPSDAPASATLETGRWRSGELALSARPDFPPRLAVVPHDTFRAAAFAATPGAPVGDVRHDVLLGDPVELERARRDLAPAGLALRPLRELRARTLARYEVRDETSADGLVGGDVVTVIAMSPPTFVAARPELAIEGELEGRDEALGVHASSPTDPDRFARDLTHGGWLRGDRGMGQVVLPRRAFDELTDEDARSVIGRSVSMRFERSLHGGIGAVEGLAMPLEVVGLAAGDAAYVPVELAASVDLWGAGKLAFNQTRGVFESPADVALAAGHVRANVFADGAEQVAAVVGALRDAGYHTEDSLAEQESLRRLGKILVFIVGFFVLGCVLNASITVLVATMMNVKSKIFEIGILRAQGVRVRAVLGIFASQGLAIGALAFVVAALCTLALEPLLRGPVRQVFGLESGGVLAGSPFEAGLWWLSATALFVAVAFSFCGVVVPAAFACRLAPVEALRRRE